MIRRLLLAAAAVLVASPALAQTPPATICDRYVPAPWWMRDPVIASVGHVRVEVPTNRAAFSATFQVVERTATEASRRAAALLWPPGWRPRRWAHCRWDRPGRTGPRKG